MFKRTTIIFQVREARSFSYFCDPKLYELILKDRIELLAELGHYLLTGGDEELDAAVRQSYDENKWFTEENVHNALRAIATSFLDREHLQKWAAAYPVSGIPHPDKTVGLVMAGNIPLVGFHDWLCVFVAGHRAKVKCSDKDKRLLPLLVKKMGSWEHQSYAYTEFLLENEPMKGIDAVIATGSNNTARYFEQYFGKYPHIIRRNRNSVALIDGHETVADLYALGRDIFSYFGLGCRNVTKLYVPRGYQFDVLLEALHEYRELINHDKYKNNFDYNFTLYIMNNAPHLNNGCLLLKEDTSLQARIASVHYEYYDDLSELEQKLMIKKNDIQCVTGNLQVPGFAVLPFGKSQEPGLTDYPDGVDVMTFLTKL